MRSHEVARQHAPKRHDCDVVAHKSLNVAACSGHKPELRHNRNGPEEKARHPKRVIDGTGVHVSEVLITFITVFIIIKSYIYRNCG